MAGSYDDAPGLRMAYDRDGTVIVRRATATNTIVDTLLTSDLLLINDEDADVFTIVPKGGDIDFIFIFPELRDIVAYTSHGNGAGEVQAYHGIRWSANTTNGIDGTWTNAGQNYAFYNGFDKIGLRNDPTTLSLSGVKALSFGTQQDGGAVSGGPHQLYCFHLYGQPAAGANPDRLRLWHGTTNAEVGPAHFDFGDVERSDVDTITFRVKNNSATLTANSIIVSMEALSDTTPTNVSAFEFSDGGSYSASLNIGNLAAGALSSVITMRRTTPVNAALALWWTRVLAVAGSWT